MNTLLICPGERPAVPQLSESAPLAVTPLLGQTLVEYWIEALVAEGCRRFHILASDRPAAVRRVVGDGRRWGAEIEILPQARECTVAEARAKYAAAGGPADPETRVVLMDHLPGQPDLPLFESYSGWHQAIIAWLPQAITPGRIGIREFAPGIFVDVRAQIAPSARLLAPCWIGEHAIIAPDVVIGPGAVLDDRSVVNRGAQVTESIVAPDTFVGEMLAVDRSLVDGDLVINCASGSCLRVPDPFLLSTLAARRGSRQSSNVLGRVAALVMMLLTAPIAFVVMCLALLRGESPLRLRLGVRPQRPSRAKPFETFAYYELTGGANWLRRWPQFWSVVRGDLTWFGNRPLRPTQAFGLTKDFERLWLAAPVGLISLADAHGCREGVGAESCAHASYYAVNASRRLHWFILTRSLVRAAVAVPVWWAHRRDAVSLPQLVRGKEAGL